MGHADAKQIEQEILKFLDSKGLKHCNLLQCSMDGPSVNIAFLRRLNAQLESEQCPPLIDLGTCSLHPVHTAFRKGVEGLPFDVEHFVTDVYQWFKLSSARREDYQQVQTEDLEECVGKFFLKPVSSRWLYLEPVCRRVIEQYEALKKYFITNLRMTGMIPSTASRYKRIKECLEDDTTLVYLHFVAYLAASLSQFMKLFQTDEPLVHVLYDKVNELTRACLRKFLKPEVVDGKEGADLIAVDCEKADNWLPRNEMEIGSGTKRVLASKADDKKKTVRLAFRKCLKTMAVYLRDHLPVNNVVLRDLRCLHPQFRKAEGGRAAVGRLCQHMRKVTKTDQLCDTVCSEWLLYASDSVLDSTAANISNDICAYWVHVSNMVDTVGEKKYQHLSYVAKASLTLSHSNASPERGFSVNNALVTTERGSLSQRSIVALRVVKEAVRLFGSCTKVPITKDFIHAVRHAHSEYALFLENQRKQALLEEEQKIKNEEAAEAKRVEQRTSKRLHEQLTEQAQLEVVQMAEQETARQLIAEASHKLSAALQGTANNLQGAKVAQAMLSAGNEKLSASTKQLADIKHEKEKIEEKLRKLELTVVDKKRTAGSAVPHTTSEPAAKKRKLH